MLMEMNLDAWGEIIVWVALAVFMTKALHSTKLIERENPELQMRFRSILLRCTIAAIALYLTAFIVDTWFVQLAMLAALQTLYGTSLIGAMIVASAIAYAHLLRHHGKSPDLAKNALIQEQLLLQSVSQTQRNLSLQRKVKDARRLNLKSQMNPHFLFNILTGIQHLLMRNESEKASLVFSKFRKLLLTGFLSQDQIIGSLKQEMDQIDQYLELEDIRLERKVQMKWVVHSEVDPKSTPFPLFILQPLVENAIWHGLSSVTVDKPEITIKIAWVDESLVIKIQDNGIGLDVEAQTKRKGRHSSRGTAIVRERLSLIHHPGTLQITGADKDHPFKSGVTACIKLPLWTLEPAWREQEQKKAS